MSPWALGYYAGARGILASWQNPWSVFFFPDAHGAWNEGYRDARADVRHSAQGPRRLAECRFEPEASR